MRRKVAIIGAGSILFTRKLLGDILAVPELEDTDFRFIDVNQRNLDMITQLAERDVKANGKAVEILATTDRRKGLEGADYILNVSRIGGVEAFQYDIDIPLKYGVDQCVGDTICAGGIMYGQRNIPQILAFCDDIREVANDQALLLNYANPNAMNTWAASLYGGAPTLGLCHGVQNGHREIADVIEFMINDGNSPEAPGYTPVATADVDIICAGINHQTWYIQVVYQGEDWAQRLLEGFERHPQYSQTEKVRIDMIRRFGYYCTESNGHFSEYVPWYRKRPAEIAKWINLSEWIHGETGGYLRFTLEGRNWFETDFPRWLQEAPAEYTPENRSAEHGSYIIEALETGRVYRGHFNVINNGVIRNLPDDCVVEVPGYVDRNGIQIPQVGELPPGCAAICNVSVNVQRLAVEAAVHGDVMLLKQAMMLDPLVGAVCTTPEISQMTDEMLIAQAEWLPQYQDALPEVKQRFASEPPLGTHDTQGAARLKVRSTEEMQHDNPQMRRILGGRSSDPGQE